MRVPVDRHAFALFPALRRGHVAIQVRGDFFPRVQALAGALCRFGMLRRFFHRAVPVVSHGQVFG